VALAHLVDDVPFAAVQQAEHLEFEPSESSVEG